MKKIDVKIEKNQKIREFLLNYGFSKTETNKIIKNKDVKLGNQRLDENDILQKGQLVTIYASEEPKSKFKILFEDENVVVLDKDCEIEVQGEGSLEKLLPGTIAVHRLDRNTTGVMIMAKTVEAEKALKQAFKSHNIQKKYVCEVYGKAKFNNQKCQNFLVKDKLRSEVKIFSNFVQGAVKIETTFNTVKVGAQTSVLVCELLTGRTHQIRAQLAFLGYPIIGDGKYGKNEINKKFKEKYQKLHCFSLIIKKTDKKFAYLIDRQFISKPAWAEKYI